MARHNLPARLTSFVGRVAEVAGVLGLLGAHRLVTLTGPGGVGKTRLALEVAATLVRPLNGGSAPPYPDGVWLVELAPLSDPGRVVQAIAATLGSRETAGGSALAALREHLRERTLLLVLDNCEHLVDACARLVDELLRSSPGLRVLATSREPLVIAGETAWRLAPLPVSPPEDLPPPAELAACDAVRLFLDRASAASNQFGLVAGNASEVARICWRLDGIPLAIELAAARVAALSAEQIAARLDDRFHLLTGGSRAALPRHQTLRATIDWSYALLTEPERVALRRLAVFTGGWTLEAAEAVCAAPADDALAPGEVLDLLAQLVHKSLVLADGEGKGVRYRLLETIREYAWERLREAGEETAIRRRHRDWYTTWAERWWPELLRRDQARWFSLFAADHENLRAALEWSRSEAAGGSDRRAPAVGEPAVRAAETELRLAASLGRFWLWRGHWHESLAWLDDALARARPGPSVARALALNWAGWLQALTGAVGDGQTRLEESAAVARRVGAWTIRSLALRHLALIADALGQDDRAAALLRDALASARRSGDEREGAFGLLQMGALALVRGDLAAAERLSGESLAGGRRCGDKGVVSHALLLLGQAAASRGQHAEAGSLLRDALAAAEEIGLQNGIAAAHRRLGDLARTRGDHAAARSAYAASLVVAHGAGVGIEAAWTLQRCAGLDAVGGAFDRAARLFGAADAWQEGAASLSLPGIFGRTDRAEVARDLAASREALGDAGFAAAFSAGQTMTLAEAVAYAATDQPTAPTRRGGGRAETEGALSRREREVARLIAAGRTNREIAGELVVAESTAERHVANIFAKLGARNRAEVAAWAATHLPAEPGRHTAAP